MKKIIVGLSVLILGLMASTGIAFAFRGMPAGFGNEEQRLAIKQAIEENDFEGWKSTIMETLTQENFNKLVEKNNAMSEKMELQNAVRQSIEDGNYGAYKEAVEKIINSHKVMSEEEFNSMVERYNATEPRWGFGFMGGFGRPMEGLGRHHRPCNMR